MNDKRLRKTVFILTLHSMSCFNKRTELAAGSVVEMKQITKLIKVILNYSKFQNKTTNNYLDNDIVNY